MRGRDKVEGARFAVRQKLIALLKRWRTGSPGEERRQKGPIDGGSGFGMTGIERWVSGLSCKGMILCFARSNLK